MKFRAPQPRQPFVGLALAAMAGIVCADRWHLPTPWLFSVTALALLVLLCRPATVTCWLFCAALFFELHTLRHWESDARELAQILTQGPRVVDATGIVWNEPEKPATWSGTITCHFVLKLESIRIGGASTACTSLVNVSWAGPMPAYGDRVTLVGSGENLPPTRNPGEFDATSYLQRRGIFSEIFARYPTDCHIVSHGHGNPLQAFGFQARHWVQRQLEMGISDSTEISAVIDGVVLGLRGESPADLKMLLQRTGTIHLFVVSGLNIAMLTFLLTLLLRLTALPRGMRLVLVILLLAVYTLITGLRTSSVRSTIMATLFLTAALVDRRTLTYNSLAAAAFAILALDSDELFSAGFQFSFAVVFVIIACAERIKLKIASLVRPDPFLPRVLWSRRLKSTVWCWHRLCGFLGLGVASWLGSLMFTVGYFHLFSPGSFVANFVAVPFAFVLLALGLASIFAAAFSSYVVLLFNHANGFIAKGLLLVLHTSADLPGGFIYVEGPRFTTRPVCELTALDLGDSGAVHVRAGGVDWLLDTGNNPHYERAVLPYLRSRGVNRLDGLLLSYGSVQRLGGALAAITDFQPRLLADSTQQERSSTRRDLHATLASDGRGKGLYSRGDFIHLGHVATLRVLYPPAGLKRSSGADLALVLQLQVGGARALLMSDSGFFTEQWLLDNEPDLRSDIVIKGQHTKDFSGTASFLARVAPQAVVCSGLGYGKSIDQLDTWEKETSMQGIAVFRQDKAGAVQIDIRDDGFELRGFVNAQTFRSRAR